MMNQAFPNTLPLLAQLVEETKKSETEIMTQAFQLGIYQLWQKHILDEYLRGKLSRIEVIDFVGIDSVKLAEQQQQAMQEDLEWALGT